MSLLLQIKDLSLGINHKIPLVQNLNIEIEEGEIHGLIGESGSGKSLTALSILRLLPPAIQILNGQILLKSGEETIDLVHLSESTLESLRGKTVGFVFQDPMTSLNPSMRCGSQVSEVLKLHDIDCPTGYKNKVLSLFEKVRLPDLEKAFSAYPHELSGGQRQRVMIAMAIACNPKLLIADEPTTALDVSVQQSIIELINELRLSDNLGVLFITHDLGIISQIADRISIMYKGKLIESGKKEAILSDPKEAYTKGLLACRPPIDKKIERLATVEEFINDGAKAELKLGQIEAERSFTKTLLEVRDLDVYYILKRNLLGRVTKEMNVLKKINFDVYKGESLGLVGESGSGKSSLGRVILKLISERSGSITYDGTSLSSLSKNEFRDYRQKIQFIFQDPYSALNSKIQIGDAIAEPLRVHGILKGKKEIKERVVELLLQVGLTQEDYQKYPHQFSGGQRQRVVIARALTLNPEFLVCDEAVSALDVSVQAQILNLLKDLQDSLGLTYLFITHDMSVVRFFCDRAIVLKEGEIIETGSVDQLFKQPSTDYTRELLSAIPGLA